MIRVRIAIGMALARFAMALVRVGAWLAEVEMTEAPSREDYDRFVAWQAAHQPEEAER